MEHSMLVAPLYECRDCLQHLEERVPDRRCPDCGGRLENIAVSRE